MSLYLDFYKVKETDNKKNTKAPPTARKLGLRDRTTAIVDRPSREQRLLDRQTRDRDLNSDRPTTCDSGDRQLRERGERTAAVDRSKKSAG